MLDQGHCHTGRIAPERLLADRLLQLAGDSDRAGLHREASALLRLSNSVREGRPVIVRDA